LFLHGILILADYLSETLRVFHIFLRASHLLIAGDACHNKVTPSGRSSTMAIYDATSCRTLQSTITPNLRTRPVASVFGMAYILCFNIFTHHLPSLPHRAMIAPRCPEILSTPFLKMRELLPQYPDRPAFYLLS